MQETYLDAAVIDNNHFIQAILLYEDRIQTEH